MGLPLFLLYDALGRLGWVGIGVGLLFSGQVEQALAYSERVMPALMLATVILFPPTSAGRRGICADNFRRSENDGGSIVGQINDVRASAAHRCAAAPDRGAEPGIPNALHMALEDLAHRHGELPRSRDLVLYCACPADAASAQECCCCSRRGSRESWPLAGGLEAWRAHRGRTVSVQ